MLPQKKPRTDSVTGDPLTTGEYVSWRVQGIIRRWTFLILITSITIVCWSTRNDHVLTWWNLCASYLAVFIESVVGLAMFGQTRRDALIIRRVNSLEQAHSQQLGELLEETKAVRQQLDHLLDESD